MDSSKWSTGGGFVYTNSNASLQANGGGELMQKLRQSTQVIVRVGPFVDVGDGFTPQIDITLGGDEAELLKAASVEVDISGRTWAAVTNCRGWYDLTLTTGDTDTVGTLTVVVQDDSDCLPVFRDFQVVEEAVYDELLKSGATGVEAACEAAIGDAVGGPFVQYVDGTNGSNSNSGQSWAEAVETIAQALTNASSGDTIIIGPGTYDENVNLTGKILHLVGKSRTQSKIVPTTGSAVTATSYSSLLNLTMTALQAGVAAGVQASSVVGALIEDCDLYGEVDGLNAPASRLILKNCHIKGNLDGANLISSYTIAKGTTFETTGTYSTADVTKRALVGSGLGVFSNCIFKGTRADASANYIAGIAATSAAQFSLLGCSFNISSTGSHTGIVNGIYTANADALISLVGGSIATSPVSGATAYDLNNSSGKVVVAGCVYDTTKTNGTITQGASGWAAAVNTEADTALSDIHLEYVPAMQDTLDVLLRTILESTVMTVTTVATLASQTSFTLAAGSPDNDAYNDCMIVLKSVSTPARKAIGIVLDYTGSTKAITLVADPGIFTLYVGDEVFIMSVPKSIADIKKLLRADKVIDTTETPWVLDYKEEGTEDVLMGKTLKKADGTNVTSENSVLGQLEQE